MAIGALRGYNGGRTAMRRGFTLIELLVASTVFVIGFVSLFALFLAGIRYRKLSEDTTRSALAASSLVAEFRLESGWEPTVPSLPSAYEGDGFAANGPELPNVDADKLYRYANQPGIWYRVMTCTALPSRPPGATPDAATDDNRLTTCLRMQLVVVPWSGSDDALKFSDIDWQLRLGLVAIRTAPTATDIKAVIDNLIERGLAFRTDAVVLRHASWVR